MIAGVDTHKDTLAVAIIDHDGRPRALDEVPNTTGGFARLEGLLKDHHVERVGIEGSGSYGRALAVHLAVALANLTVVEVPTLMTSRERRGQPGKGKTDPVDAVAIARITAREPDLPAVRLSTGPAADLRALLDYRDQLVAERAALANRVHAELTGLRPGYQASIPSLATNTGIQRALQSLRTDASVRAQLSVRRLTRIQDIDAEIAEWTRQIRTHVNASGTTLTDIYGIGPLVAARFLAEIIDIGRYPNRNAFASANGTGPLAASSGRTVRHRLNRGGNRQLNRALYTIAITQIRADTEGRAYYERKRAAGKTNREALRCLKRRLSDQVYKTMRHDREPATLTVDAA